MDEKQEVQHAHFPGPSLALKVALVTTVTMFLLMGAYGQLTYSTVRAELNREIDALGVNLARVLAAPDVSVWEATFNSPAEAAERVVVDSRRFGRYLKEKYGITVSPVVPASLGGGNAASSGQTLDPEVRAEQDSFRAEVGNAVSRNRNRLSSLIGHDVEGKQIRSEIIDAFILYEGQDKSLVRANPQAKTFRSQGRPRPYVVEAAGNEVATEAEILEGSFEDVGTARSYSVPIRGPEGEVTHRAYVFLSKQHIDDRLGSLLTRMVLLSLVFVAIGGGISHLVTIRMTRPIMSLVKEVDTVSPADAQHRTEVQTSDEIGLLARTMDSMVRRLNEARLQHDEEILSDVHRKLVPEAIPYVPHYDVDVLHKLTPEIGGAYYDFLELPDRKVGLVVVQASHRGLGAGMNAIMTGVLLQAQGHGLADPRRLLELVNAEMVDEMREGMSLSVLLGVLDPRTGEVALCSAGDLCPVVHRRGSDQAERIHAGGLPVGVEGPDGFDPALEVKSIMLQPGDRLVLGNDGALRIRNPRGQEFGSERWLRAVAESGAEKGPFVKNLQARLGRFRHKAPIESDVVVVSVEALEARKS